MHSERTEVWGDENKLENERLVCWFPWQTLKFQNKVLFFFKHKVDLWSFLESNKISSRLVLVKSVLCHLRIATPLFLKFIIIIHGWMKGSSDCTLTSTPRSVSHKPHQMAEGQLESTDEVNYLRHLKYVTVPVNSKSFHVLLSHHLLELIATATC